MPPQSRSGEEIAEHFGCEMTEKRIAKLAGMTVEQYRAMREREAVEIPNDEGA